LRVLQYRENLTHLEFYSVLALYMFDWYQYWQRGLALFLDANLVRFCVNLLLNWEYSLYTSLRKSVGVCVGLSVQELAEENEVLTEQIKEFRRRTAMLRILIEELEQSYEDSKRFVVVQRYRLIKSMIKRVTQSSLV